MNARVLKSKLSNRLKRKRRVRAKISGSATLPRVSIFRSNRYLTVQAIDDETSTTLVGMNSKSINQRANKEGAVALAAEFASKLKEKGITSIVLIETVTDIMVL
jgi:large subunit ribosomal protein L18